MQTGFIAALQPFGVGGPLYPTRRPDEPGLPPGEKFRDGQAERDRANDRAAGPQPNSGPQAGLIHAGHAVAAQESQSSDTEQDPRGLTEEEQRVVAELKKRDAEVRAHEAAHKAAAGAYAGAISYTYQQGPDGRRYAVGGEVPIDISTIPGDPHATVRKMQQIRRAATAPAEPSGSDRAVAAAATKAILQAQAEIAAERSEKIADNQASADTDPAKTSQTGNVSPNSATESGLTPDDDAQPAPYEYATPYDRAGNAAGPAGGEFLSIFA